MDEFLFVRDSFRPEDLDTALILAGLCANFELKITLKN